MFHLCAANLWYIVYISAPKWWYMNVVMSLSAQREIFSTGSGTLLLRLQGFHRLRRHGFRVICHWAKEPRSQGQRMWESGCGMWDDVGVSRSCVSRNRGTPKPQTIAFPIKTPPRLYGFVPAACILVQLAWLDACLLPTLEKCWALREVNLWTPSPTDRSPKPTHFLSGWNSFSGQPRTWVMPWRTTKWDVIHAISCPAKWQHHGKQNMSLE